MIKEIQIENFKSIQSLNLELGRLNVFIGANGSGKSNILEAITFGGAATDNKLGKEFFKNRGIRYAEPYRFFSGFEKGNSKKSINIGFKDQKNLEEQFKIHHTSKWEIGVEKDDLKILTNNGIQNSSSFQEEAIVYQTLRDVAKIKSDQIERFKNELIHFLIYAPENAYLRNFEEEGAIEPLGVQGEGLFNLVVKIYKTQPESFAKINHYLRLLFDWFDGFDIPKDLMFTERRINIKDYNLEEGLQYFDQRSANEGFLYLLFYLTLFISDETPKFFAIDNIDTAINPKLCWELIKILSKLAKEHDKQVILTTHNSAVLDGINLNDDDQRLFVISRNGNGQTKALRIFKEETPEGQRRIRMSEQFLRGYIGGLPDNF